MASADDDRTGESQRPSGKRPPTHGNPDADPVLVHRRYVEQRLWSGNTERADSEVDEAEPDSTDPSVRGDEAPDDEAPDGGTGGDDDEVREQDLEDLARERYARALDQWHDLPGAVSRPPTEVTGTEGAVPDDGDGDETDESSP